MSYAPRYTDYHAEIASQLFQNLETHWQGLDDGMFRPGFSTQETQAMDLVSDVASNLGYAVYSDAVGNRIFFKAGKNPDLPVHMGGSHLDAVPKGGRYDGPAGVVARLLAGHMAHEKLPNQEAGFGVIAFRNEESPWFGDYAVGSKLGTAQLPASFLQKTRKDTGQTLAQHMSELGVDVMYLEHMLENNIQALPTQAVATFIETHIEQGSQLMRAGCDVGIVTGVRGNVRFTNNASIVFNGKTGHTGAVPQAARVDAVVMAANFIAQVNDLVSAWDRVGRDAVVSFPVAHTKPEASATTIADYFRVMVEVRSIDEDVLHDAQAIIKRRAQSAAGQFNGTVTLVEPVYNKPAVMDENIIGGLGVFAKAAKILAMQMSSGAGHDAAIMAWANVPSAMLFVAHGNEGISHDPSEIMGRTDNEHPVAVGSAFSKAIMMDAMHIMRHCVCPTATQYRGSFTKLLLERGGCRLSA